ncbi:IclR family transcriptional regulator [Streptomyces boncukensis]|uniref:IclR family transcriptional regulator n=1 Tax=Streptomyces boncukensis TaxID=2711219 RepID=A0A6G4WUG1_9ACTN|nr:IclR family transcriptional regulator [Streptomyces boncukensis]NGO68916.1 IclR family transcriptional regulator [Streptomyces boncukensis]
MPEPTAPDQRPASRRKPKPAVRSAADRLLHVLGAFDQHNTALSLSDISRRAELPLATAHRLVGALARWGALERDERGDYHIGLRLWELAALAPRGLGMRQAAMPFLEDLYEATHENVHLAVRDGLEVVYIERISARGAVGVRSRVGARWPLHATGVGLVLLAHGSAQLQEQVCAGPLASFTPHTVTEPARLRRTLAEVRRSGCAVSDRQITEDALSVAAPVRGARGTVVASVSVVVHAQDAPTRALIPAVRVAARGVSRSLGWRPCQAPVTDSGGTHGV